MPAPALRPIVRAVAVAVSLVAALALGTAASAHTALVSSTPAEGETVTELAEVTLEFTEQLLDIGNELVMVAPDGTRTPLEVGDVSETVTAAVPPEAIAPGANTLLFRVVSADGHPIEGEVGFTYAPAEGDLAPSGTPSASADATPASSPSASATPAASSPTPSAAPDVAAPTDDEGPGVMVWLLGGLAATSAATAAIIVARRGPVGSR